MRRSTIISIAVLLILYLISYGWYRQTHIEVWEKDGNEYVIFSENNLFLYYLFRPVSIIDGKLTGMNFHIRQHR